MIVGEMDGMFVTDWSAACCVCGNQTLMMDPGFEVAVHRECVDVLWESWERGSVSVPA